MVGNEQRDFQREPSGHEGQKSESPVRLVPFHGEIPEQLVGFFGRLTPWTWRHLRTIFCRFPETRRLANILRTIDLVLEKAPHTLARGHWSISGYQDARRKLESAIARLGHLSNLVAADARVRLPVVPERGPRPYPPRPMTAGRPPMKSSGPFQKLSGGLKKKISGSSEAA